MSLTDRDDKTVFVLGAGASYGDTLIDSFDGQESTGRLPLINHFFQAEYLGGDMEEIKGEYRELIDHITIGWNMYWHFGTESWCTLNLEDVFTSLAIENEFAPSDTDGKAQTQLLLNKLKRYIRQLIGMHSINTYGKFSRQLVESLRTQDSIITFNYDLLLDEAFMYKEHPRDEPQHYEKFADKLLGRSLLSPNTRISFESEQGLFLKMHGSLNWFLCTNNLCPNSNQPQVVTDTTKCLVVSKLDEEVRCDHCAGLLTAYLVPPLLNKPILRDRISRNIWSNALSILQSASKIVIIGYSFPVTDFYSEWLFRTAIRSRKRDIKLWIVNPLNNPDRQETNSGSKAAYDASSADFFKRWRNIIPNPGPYYTNYCRFDQIADVLNEIALTH